MMGQVAGADEHRDWRDAPPDGDASLTAAGFASYAMTDRAAGRGGLLAAERATLGAWEPPPWVDTVIDLSSRPWHVAEARAVLGVFARGREQAGWLIIGGAGGWAAVRCTEGMAGEIAWAGTLAGVLASIETESGG